MPTVQQVWRILPPKTGLVAGEPGIYNEVSWVVTLKPTPPAFDRLRGKELAFVEMSTANSLGITLPYLITSLAEQGVSAFVVAGDISSAAIETAGKLKIPLFRLPPVNDLKALENQISSFIRDEREHLYQLEQELTKELMKLTLAGKGAGYILQKIEETTSRVAVLLGEDFTPLYSSGSTEIPELKERLTALFPVPPLSIFGIKLSNKMEAFISPVTGKLGNEGHLLVIAPAGDLREADRTIARVGALSLALEISRQQAVEDVEDKYQTEMIDSLLNGKLGNAAITDRAERLGLDLSQNYAAIVASTADTDFRWAALVKKASLLFKKAVVSCRAGVLIILYPTAANPAADDLRRLGKDISRQLSASLGVKISVGIGRSYTGAAGLRTSFQEAERSLAVGKKLFGEGSASFFGDLGVYRLLLSIDADELKSFCQDAIGRLSEYDREHDGELLTTLEATLCYPTLADTAKALHVHRNTLLYRLQRIQDICNINLDDGETRLLLHLALRAGEVIRVS